MPPPPLPLFTLIRAADHAHAQNYNHDHDHDHDHDHVCQWVLGMIENPRSVVEGLTAHIEAQKGASAVTGFLDALRAEDGSLPKGLKVWLGVSVGLTVKAWA